MPNPHYSPEFVANDLFNRPKANILLSVDSLGADTLQSFDLQHLQTLAAQHTAVPLDHTSYPQNALATAATLATGANPAQHGIVANAWKKGNGRRPFGSNPLPPLTSHAAADIPLCCAVLCCVQPK